MSVYDKYEAVIGLEVHMQLLTKSKAYSSDATEYGGLPNTQISPLTLGHPGTLPRTNKKVIEYAVKLGLACNCAITKENQYARKNYFYADLPKGYQITQDKTPICTGGFITIKQDDGSEKHIQLIRIHMEEDAGKSIHDQDAYDTLVDLNRAGVALLEMVSEPDIRSGEEAYKYLTEVRKLVRYLDICDGNMEEGSLRCDANISVRLKGDAKFGRRVEVKNMNSIRNVQRAIEFEVKRQIDATENGEHIAQDTRSFDATTGTTFIMRSKEMAHDYRYFPEPDLPPVIVTEEYIASIKAKLPALPNDLIKKYTTQLGLSAYDALVLTETKEIALYFEELTKQTKNYKAAANWVMGAVKSYLNENAIHISNFPVKVKQLADLIALIDANKVSNTVATQKIFPELVAGSAKSPLQIAEEKNLIQESDVDSLKQLVEQALQKYPEKITEYKNGKVSLLSLFMGEVMKLSKGKADPKVTSGLVKEMLDNHGI
ncbi:MAG: Asp-tRNA(Asn)/Glu-tRNA(Gln) amidotransferase subunit GatB [Bacteroidetes bacterium]|nr:Asp-tRNA(Asn)/Glu-tRNA(Gln) amidotransferase subunit GatB [Bacteroidota bacterium]